jgi:beta-phosphoglucomutase
MDPIIHAFIFDLNGTMINDMEYHIEAWHQMLNEDLGAGLTRDQVKAQMYGSNSELLIRVFGEGHFTPEQMKGLSLEKEKRYQEAYRDHLELIKGLPGFLHKIQAADKPMAIASAAIPFNIDFVLDNLNIRPYFNAIVSADDVSQSKPHPETYLKAAALLNQKPSSCLVFEDAPKGVESALLAGMPCIVLRTLHGTHEFEKYSNILHFLDDYNDPFLDRFI